MFRDKELQVKVSWESGVASFTSPYRFYSSFFDIVICGSWKSFSLLLLLDKKSHFTSV